MIHTLSLLCLAALAQITSATGIPDDARIFTVTIREKQGERVVNAAIKVDGSFVSEFDPANRPARVELHFDTPWSPTPPEALLAQRIVEIEPEPSLKRTRRYESSGFQEVTVEGGGKVWVENATLDRIQRGSEIAAARDEGRAAVLAAHAPPSSMGSDSAGRPGFARLWGRHIVVAVTALVLLFVTVRACF